MKIYIHRKTWMFTAALFIIAQIWKQLTCPLAGERISKLWYIYTVEICTVTRRESVNKPQKDMEEPSMHISKWKKPIWEDYSWFQLYDILGTAKLWRQWKDQWLPGFQEERGQEGRAGRAWGIFRAVKLFYLILCWWIHDTVRLSKTTEQYNTKGEPWSKRWTLVNDDASIMVH